MTERVKKMTTENQQLTEAELEQIAKAARRAYFRDYYALNKDKVNTKRKARRQANHAEMLEKERAYRAANPDKVREWQTRHWAKKAMQQTTAKRK